MINLEAEQLERDQLGDLLDTVTEQTIYELRKQLKLPFRSSFYPEQAHFAVFDDFYVRSPV